MEKSCVLLVDVIFYTRGVCLTYGPTGQLLVCMGGRMLNNSVPSHHDGQMQNMVQQVWNELESRAHPAGGAGVRCT
jgi:hypothetical protein